MKTNLIILPKSFVEELITFHGSKTWKGVLSTKTKAFETSTGDIAIYLSSYKKCLIEKAYWLEIAFKIKAKNFPEIIIRQR